MTTKESIQAVLEKLSEEELAEVYNLLTRFAAAKRAKPPRSLMAELAEIKIDGPADFAANLDLYLSGEKRADPDLH